MVEPLEQSYFGWLYAKVCDPAETDPENRYEHLLYLLYCTEFEWFVTGDDNRAEDGLDLRDEFLSFLNTNGDWETSGCSVLEMLIAFSRKAEFDTSISADRWFWKMLENLNISSLNDATEFDDNYVAEILDVFVTRRYSPTGHGGIFPLREAEYDQRFIEILYQFSEYSYQNDIA